ncbi:uncharacterized protein N7529_002181 [Penicillium soppii]|uniref:uncharacterized protein n=1 Tax=Penicillium soppii TaxID=69789 RepID=UPI0025474544|nr:uncharacterized protein N7529_002181 [Penicillium soppii]KAJ5873751.1 hypothetical protein N7529_002181 [Penicillium soppii]
MANVSAEAIGRGRGPIRSRNIGLLSIFGVLSGTWLMFGYLAPRQGTVLATNEELGPIKSADSKQTDAGNTLGNAIQDDR